MYPEPEPAKPFTALTQAVIARLPGYPPYGGVFDEVVPHLTVAECERPGASEDPQAVLGEVERAIVGAVPIGARAHEVWPMIGNGRWTARSRFTLGG